MKVSKVKVSDYPETFDMDLLDLTREDEIGNFAVIEAGDVLCRPDYLGE